MTSFTYKHLIIIPFQLSRKINLDFYPKLMLCSMNSGFSAFVFFLFSIFLISFSGHSSAAEVTLKSIQIYQTHEWLHKPTVYFHCKGENKTVLPDVKKANMLYTFKGEESWQPLTGFSSKKCKRCGIYEEDKFFRDDKFDDWEFCPSDFKSSDGRYVHVKEKEFNATFSCSACLHLGADDAATHSDDKSNGLSVAVVILISAAVTTVVILVFIGGYKYWQVISIGRRRRDSKSKHGF